ncbi:MAG: NAD-dependent epimerase/dehydratase family protein, partial [Calditrichaeota bacterium]|nr:NAD-dependent epimerase/dehydratase family protein [Calditrichota bacterium]
MKTAFVTGANGFVGSHLVDRLLAENYSVKCLVRKSSNLRWLDGKDVELVYGSLTDKESLKTGIQDVNLVYHVAGVLFGRS